ncbi:MAG TPA: ATP synthase F1 subunit gamma [Firmicutes bacterium]|nr:ATP synthase F1 subunit gamma [Bacillota bacterium]
MDNLRQIKKRIRIVREVRHVTRAMKLVAAAKLRSAQERVQAARPYARKTSEVLVDICSMMSSPPHPFLQERPVQHVGLVVITSDRRLCGRYNQDILELAMREAAKFGGPEKVFIIAVGRVARDFFRAHGFTVKASYERLSSRPTFAWAENIADRIGDFYTAGIFDRVYLIYSRFHSAMEQVPRTFQLIPAKPSAELQASSPEAGGVRIRIWNRDIQPSALDVIDRLVTRYMQAAVYRALLEAEASERGARMTAMTTATDNATEMIEKLSTAYNRERQMVITREISEIIAGAEAVR